MRLSRLLAGQPVTVVGPGAERAVADPEVRGVAHDSRRVEAGDLFVCWSGQHHDGRIFAAEAVARGACAVLAAGPPVGSAPVMPWLTAGEPRALLGPIAARLFDNPDRELRLVGVTGTNGKSTVATLVGRLLDAAGCPSGVLGTLGYHFRDHDYGGERTTPEASDLFRVLRAMREAGACGAAMEVSSHALAQGRVAGAAFDVGVFLNLTRDHLDFHRDLDDYFAAKARLFEMLKPGGHAVVNVEDPYGRALVERFPEALGFGAGGAVAVVSAQLDARGIVAQLSTPRGEVEVRSPLLGRYNLTNVLAAVAAGEALALPHAAVAAGLAAQGPLVGRMEPIDCGQPFPVFVDYAHTDAALEAALRAVRESTGRKVVVVFGCGGDRDPGKRPLMGKVAGQLADLPIVTSDNPRSEDPLAIISAVEEGLKASGNTQYRVVPDRREAIRRALAVAGPGGWAVLVAGKGHEREQIVGAHRLPFSDQEEIAAALAERWGGAGEA